MNPYILQSNPSREDTIWNFSVDPAVLQPRRRNASSKITGKLIKFSATEITLRMDPFPSNRILHSDDASCFILCSFGDLRFPDSTLSATAEYIARLLKTGISLNGVQYRFYHHSNSQLRGRSCFMRQAKSDNELDARIYEYGDFGNIMNISKRAKRIGLLFSEAQIDYLLDPAHTADILDIKAGEEIFSDGCGLISQRLAIQLSRAKGIIFRGSRYTPVVFQIRYLGYKGVLMLHPQLDKQKKALVEFRKSMKKFSTTKNLTFSVVDYSKPYSFGRLNNDVIVLLSSLGITSVKLLEKQQSYFHWIASATEDLAKAIDFTSSMGNYPLAEKIMLSGLDDPGIQRSIRTLQLSEIASFRNDRQKSRSRIIIHKSRLIFGVCDPFKVLKEGEVHIRITTSRKGPSTPIHGDVLVVRNPCLHPGDCLKLRAVQHQQLSHLVDCIVFASVAKPGHQAAPAMSSGGDLDGDKYFVCWDPDLIPTRISESYDYPPNKERVSKNITRADLSQHFAMYNNAGLARVAALHGRWACASPLGALSVECQELNALHSQSVDGARIKIPDRLTTPPEPTNPYILDILADAASAFASEFAGSEPIRSNMPSAGSSDGLKILKQLLQSDQNALSEYELCCLILAFARKHSLSMAELRPLMDHIDVSALATSQKYALSTALGLSKETDPYIWNSLFRSDILTPRDLYERSLNRPFSMQRLYSSKTDERFSVGIFMRGDVPWDEDPEVSDNVVVCSFMPKTSAALTTHRPCTKGYRLHCSELNLQLYNKHRGDTFIFITRPPAASGAQVATSMALQKFSDTIRRQLGQINRMPVVAIELHVVSNRDRISHQFFDMWFDHVPTEERIKRFDRRPNPYRRNDIRDIEWDDHTDLKEIFTVKQNQGAMNRILAEKSAPQIERIMEFAIEQHAEDELFFAFKFIITREPLRREPIIRWMDRFPELSFALLKAYPPDELGSLPPELEPFSLKIIQNFIRSANHLGIAVLAGLEKLTQAISTLSVNQYTETLMLTSLCVRPSQLVQEILLVLNDCRTSQNNISVSHRYGYKHALAIAFDRAEEAADECPCGEDGRPRRQRTPPTQTTLSSIDSEHPNQVKAVIRIDARTSVRLHSHVRLQAASKPENKWIEALVMDGVVIQSLRGELKIELFHPPPPEMERMDWNLYNAGSIATARAMMDAVTRLLEDGSECCRFHHMITGESPDPQTPGPLVSTPAASGTTSESSSLNASQQSAVESIGAPLTLIWGPPGTGKTTVVVQILRKILAESPEELPKILMTASTHNAVDNVLERFIEINKVENLIREEQILRVATDQSKVNKNLQHFTIDARVGGDMNENNRLVKQAQERVRNAVLIFTTCAGAGLGILRKVNFEIAVIDEASQITEPCALIPLVKGIRRGILVGDHVQLRPTVRKMGKALEFDVSLLERLYRHHNTPGMVKAMLDVQYRSPKELNAFPSQEFYENRLQTGIQDSAEILRVLSTSSFPWPEQNHVPVPVIFVQCSVEEDMGGMSKSNIGQIELVERITQMLLTPKKQPDEGDLEVNPLQVTVLAPYTKQVQALRHTLPSSIPSYTIDSFQGRESDIIIFTTVRCNAEGDIGFVEDPRRVNVMWTRAKLALIIIGDRRTLAGNQLWKRALDACTEVALPAILNSVTT